jgi:hypothetical protein
MKRVALLACMVVMAGACKKNEEAPAATQPTPAAQEGGMPAGHPPIGGAPGAAMAVPPAGPSGEIKGVLDVAPTMAGKIKAGDTIFLMARNGATNGMVAVARLTAPEKFPLPFTLTGSNVMLPGGSLSGELRLTARVDKDGDAMSKNPGDVTGEVPELVKVPADNVRLVFSQVL